VTPRGITASHSWTSRAVCYFQTKVTNKKGKVARSSSTHDGRRPHATCLAIPRCTSTTRDRWLAPERGMRGRGTYSGDWENRSGDSDLCQVSLVSVLRTHVTSLPSPTSRRPITTCLFLSGQTHMMTSLLITTSRLVSFLFGSPRPEQLSSCLPELASEPHRIVPDVI